MEKLYPGVETIRLSPTRSVRLCLESILVWGLVLDLWAGLCYSSLVAMVGVSTMIARSPDAIYQID